MQQFAMLVENRVHCRRYVGVGWLRFANARFDFRSAAAQLGHQPLDVREFRRRQRAHGVFDFGERHAGT